MSILGHFVEHKIWGRGTITDYAGDTITVQFPHTPTGDKQALFKMPGAFTGGYLTAVDNSLDEQIKQIVKEQACSVCGAANVDTQLVNRKRYCKPCSEEYLGVCSRCRKTSEKAMMITIKEGGFGDRITFMCVDCVDIKSFVCSSCGHRYMNNMRADSLLDGNVICKSCFDADVRVCDICKNTFDSSNGEWIHQTEKDEEILVCPQCIDKHTFTCSVCDELRLHSDLVDSRYVPRRRKVCLACAKQCETCQEILDDAHTISSFGATYCKNCWNAQKTACPICGMEFVPSSQTQSECPDCVNAQRYMDQLQKIDLFTRHYKALDYNDLSYINRCLLFTKLFDNDTPDSMQQTYFPYDDPLNQEEPFYYMVMRFFQYKIVIVRIPDDISKLVLKSCNVTMTAFRAKQGRYEVLRAITQWLSEPPQCMTTSAGQMRMLLYPALLRVQTLHDQFYGKQWDGYGGYIESNNYGDTTSFLIVGVLV